MTNAIGHNERILIESVFIRHWGIRICLEIRAIRTIRAIYECFLTSFFALGLRPALFFDVNFRSTLGAFGSYTGGVLTGSFQVANVHVG